MKIWSAYPFQFYNKEDGDFLGDRLLFVYFLKLAGKVLG